jgi:hypothetical protein
VHEHLPPEDSTYARVAKHLAATLRSLRISKDLAEEVVALVAPLRAEIGNSSANPAAKPPKGEAAMAATTVSTGRLSKGTSRVHRNVSEDTQTLANLALESVDRDEIYDLIRHARHGGGGGTGGRDHSPRYIMAYEIVRRVKNSRCLTSAEMGRLGTGS